MSAVAIIPARGGSKRIPRKNIRDFHGKPIIAYSIESALKSGVFEKVIVSTDDAEIKEISYQYGAHLVMYRPPSLSGDNAPINSVMQSTVVTMCETNLWPHYVCCVYATAPMMSPEDIVAGFKKIQENTFDFAFGATRFDYPVFRGFTLDNNSRPQMIFPEHFLTRSQDLPSAWHDAGQFCWGTTDAWMHRRPVFSDKSAVIEIPPSRSIDIDTESDWVQCETMFESASKPLTNVECGNATHDNGKPLDE